MPGPRPTPTHLKLIRGNPGKRALNRNEPQPPIPPEPPDFLMPTAKDEWHRIAGTLHALGLLTAVDTMPFAAYCLSVARWEQAEHALAAMAERDPTTAALMIKTGVGSVVMNPLLRVSMSAANDMVRYAAEFGLSPAARSRVANSLAAQIAPSKFDGLLGG